MEQPKKKTNKRSPTNRFTQDTMEQRLDNFKRYNSNWQPQQKINISTATLTQTGKQKKPDIMSKTLLIILFVISFTFQFTG